MSKNRIGGYAGKLLRVDLTTERVIEEVPDEATLRMYLGGTGLGAKILYEEVPPGVEWSDPENRLILASGPLGGTRIPGSGSVSVVTKGPLTNGAASAQANGFFGAFLKSSGFDGIVLQGASKRWVYLCIENGAAELRDASHLVGKGTYETVDLIKEELGKKERQMSVVSIGPAGENLVKFAGIYVDKGHSASHNGPGAVMGSKKLKAIAVSRGRLPVEVKDKERLLAIANEISEKAKTYATYKWGTLFVMTALNEQHWLPVKNYTTSIWPIDEDKLATFEAEYIREHFKAKRNPCWACQQHHVEWVTITEGPYAGMVIDAPEYEQFAAWSSNIGNTDVASVIMLSYITDNLGFENNEAGWTISWVMECYERGILTKEDTNGLEMTWGNVEATKKMLEMIARREGIGDVLAEGVMRAAQRIGGEALNWAIHTKKGNTPRGHDHRYRWYEMFDTCVSNTGTIEVHLADFGMTELAGPDRPIEMSTAVAKTKGWMSFEDSMVVCRFYTHSDLTFLAPAVSAATGWDFTPEEANTAGLRIVNLLRAFNIRHGMTNPRSLEYPSARYGSVP
ncbi:MAG: aldehyde ferredoxin oxidoreductase family protein, partial [Candidatus Bathyarchaeia archaeon]